MNFVAGVNDLMRSGSRFAFGELVGLAARARRHDETLWSAWRTRVGPVAMSADAAAFCAEDMAVIRDVEALDEVDAEFVTVVAVPTVFDNRWMTEVRQQMAAGADVVYSDHLDCHFRPFFKPDYSPDLGSENYLPFVAARTSMLRDLVEKTPGLRDLSTARVIDHVSCSASRVAHIPRVLGRVSEPLETLSRTPIDDVSRPVSIVIPTRDKLPMLKACVASIRAREQRSEIIIVDHCSVEPETIDWLNQANGRDAVRVVHEQGEFNWSRLSNIGAAKARGDVLIFLNNDVEVISPDWSSRLSALASRDGVGAAGPMLLYPDQRIQHAGVVIGYGDFADHVYAGAPIQEAQEACFVSPTVTRNVAAVTGACLATTRERFQELGGFDEGYPVAGDVDYCLRALKAGYRNIYDGETRLFHFESSSRQKGLTQDDCHRLRKAIDQAMPNGDLYFNPNLSLSSRFPLVALH